MPKPRPELGPVESPPADEVLAALGRALRQHRLRFSPRLSQEALAERAELHRTYASALERGEKNITITRLVKLAAALNVSISALIRAMEREMSRRR